MIQEQTPSLLGKLILAGIALYALNELARHEENDTVNYRLWHKGRLVYEGICFEDRLDARIAEHLRAGKRFDNYTSGRSKTRTHALATEFKRIRKHRPKFNVHHNY